MTHPPSSLPPSIQSVHHPITQAHKRLFTGRIKNLTETPKKIKNLANTLPTPLNRKLHITRTSKHGAAVVRKPPPRLKPITAKTKITRHHIRIKRRLQNLRRDLLPNQALGALAKIRRQNLSDCRHTTLGNLSPPRTNFLTMPTRMTHNHHQHSFFQLASPPHYHIQTTTPSPQQKHREAIT